MIKGVIDRITVGHGGARAGSGRKALEPGARKVMKSFRMDPRVAEYLSAQDNGTAVVEGLIKRSKAFRDWKKENGHG